MENYKPELLSDIPGRSAIIKNNVTNIYSNESATKVCQAGHHQESVKPFVTSIAGGAVKTSMFSDDISNKSIPS